MNQSFERFCRLCAEEQEVTVMLYSEEASDMLLLEKLRKYLQLEICEDDKFPKTVCIKCCSKLQTLCEFIEQVRKAQDNLHTLRCTTELTESSTTILNAIKKEETEFTEVCIDPMDVLMPDETSTEHHKYPDNEEVVTLKLLGKDQLPIKEFVCNVCSKSFALEQSLKTHSWIHIKDEEYTCYTCQKSFRFQADLNKHTKSHTQTVGCYLFSCEICGRRFKANYTYSAHMKEHKRKETYTCNVCGRCYSRLAALKLHSITHSTDKPYQCKLCDKKFKRKQELKFHMNRHTGEKPYKCKQCDKTFSCTGNLHAHHSRVHVAAAKLLQRQESQTQTDDKSYNMVREPKIFKYYCQICKKGCQRQENYVYHMFQHTGEKPFKCTQCTQRFITQRSLSSHYDRLHPAIGKPAMPMPIFCPKMRKWL